MNLEQLTTEIIADRSNLLVRLLRKPVTYLTAAALSLLSCGASQGTPIVPSGGNGSSPQYCQTDQNCPGEEICVNYVCVASNQAYPQQPQAVYDQFVADLEKGGVEQVVTTYFDPAVQQKYRQALSSQSLAYLAQQLKGKTLILQENGTNFQEFEVTLSNGISYAIQMFKLYHNGVGEWKIHGL